MGARISLIAAIASTGVIGKDNALPWRIPEDLQHFKALTMGKPMIMGRRTFNSLGRPLPGRDHVVVSTTLNVRQDRVFVVASFSEALDRAMQLASRSGAGEVMVIGGASIYREALAVVERLYITEVQGEYEGDTYFPAFDTAQWTQIAAREGVSTSEPPAYRFVTWERATSLNRRS